MEPTLLLCFQSAHTRHFTNISPWVFLEKTVDKWILHPQIWAFWLLNKAARSSRYLFQSCRFIISLISIFFRWFILFVYSVLLFYVSYSLLYSYYFALADNFYMVWKLLLAFLPLSHIFLFLFATGFIIAY